MEFFKSMLSEGGAISSKRWLIFTFGLGALFALIYSVLQYQKLIEPMYNTTLIFILVLAGIITSAQLLSIWKGGNPNAPKEEIKAMDSINTPSTQPEGQTVTPTN
jgi:hypothetical protein